jgi:hypothetical protein
MNKIKYLLILTVLAAGAGCAIQKEVPSRTLVRKVGPGVTASDYDLYYSLPRTVFEIDVTVEKKITKPGPFAAYAERFLGLTNVPTRESVVYSIADIRVSSYPEKDPGQTYLIETEGKPLGARVSLTADGLIRGINLPVNPELALSQEAMETLQQKKIDYPEYPDLTLRKHTEPIPDTIYRLVRTDTSFMKIPLLRKEENQKSLLLQAQEAADVLMKLRTGRFKLLNGDYAYVENDGSRLPEGPALEVIVRELGIMEDGYVSLFAGRTQTERQTVKFIYTPAGQGIVETNTLFSFSEGSGIEAPETTGSDPVILRFTQDTANPMDQVRWPVGDAKAMKTAGLAYRMPQKTHVEITRDGERLFNRDFLVAQAGRIDFIPAGLLGDESTAIEFYPAYGSIKNIFRR